MLDPVTECIQVAEKESSTIGDVMWIMDKMQRSLHEFLSEDEDAIEKALERLEKPKFISSAHYLANLLHPKHRGRNISSEQRVKALSFMQTYAGKLGFTSSDHSRMG